MAGPRSARRRASERNVQRATATEVVHVPEVVEAENPDLALARTDGGIIGEFVAGLRQFFGTATDLERSAKGTLVAAKALTPPANADEDSAIQRFIRTANADRKAVEEHWTITSRLSQFHRRLTSMRARATGPLEEAATIANRLHNGYTDAERRRAAQEQDRLRREAEERARQDRERELAQLEAEAVAREEASGDLSARETTFVDEYLRNGGNAQAAARFAGYKDAIAQAARLTTNEKIKAAIQAKQDAAQLREQLRVQREMPVETEDIEVKPDIQKEGPERTTWSAELLDETALVEAVISGKYGIPRDVLRADPVKLNDYARSLHQLLDRWPGVRAKKTTKVL